MMVEIEVNSVLKVRMGVIVEVVVVEVVVGVVVEVVDV